MSFWKSSVHTLSERVRGNPTYPFIEVAANIYYLSVFDSRFYYLALVQFCNVALGAYFAVCVSSAQGTTVCCTLLCILAACLWWYKDARVYILNQKHRHYRFYIGDHLVTQGPFHNIYVRLKGFSSEADERCTHAYVELGGRDVEAAALSGISGDVSAIRQQAILIAERLSLNYFDIKDVSLQHIVRHRCNYLPGNKIA